MNDPWNKPHTNYRHRNEVVFRWHFSFMEIKCETDKIVVSIAGKHTKCMNTYLFFFLLLFLPSIVSRKTLTLNQLIETKTQQQMTKLHTCLYANAVCFLVFSPCFNSIWWPRVKAHLEIQDTKSKVDH